MKQIGHDGTYVTNEYLMKIQSDGMRQTERDNRIGSVLAVTGLVGMAPSTCLLLSGAATYLVGHAINDPAMMDFGSKTFLGSAVADGVSLGTFFTGLSFFRHG